MFPFTLFPMEAGGHHYGPADFRETFHKSRPSGMSWYTYSVTVNSPTEVEFAVYEMSDFCEGGVGNVKARFMAGVSADITRPSIERRATEMAHSRRKEELSKAEREIISQYAEEILASINHTREPGA